ncbi:MAG: hypothetical protein ACLSHC_03030 [Bilophila wadsworthia]
MNHYAAILNLRMPLPIVCNMMTSLEKDIQGTLERSILLGHGQTEYAAMMDAFHTLRITEC